MSTAEFDALAGSTGKPPGVDAGGMCVYLVDGRCSVYQNRPLICRMYGAVESLPCPHGCKPDRGALPDAESRALLLKATEIGGPPKIAESAEDYIAEHLPSALAQLHARGQLHRR